MRWPRFCRHVWTIIGPIGLGRGYAVASCRCVKCETERERYLDGSESNSYIEMLMPEWPRG